MKAVNKLAILLSLSSFAPLFASAKSVEQSYLASYHGTVGSPVPVAVVSPHVSSEYIGSTVELEFIVDTKGLVSDVSVKSSPDSTLSEEVVAAVKEWKFSPALRDGMAVTTKVVLPVHIVDSGSDYAAN
jgi:TonB family protein